MTAANIQPLAVNINEECADILRQVMADRGIDATEAIRRAVGYLGLAEDVRLRGGKFLFGEAAS